jgi:hypothetical protein
MKPGEIWQYRHPSDEIRRYYIFEAFDPGDFALVGLLPDEDGEVNPSEKWYADFVRTETEKQRLTLLQEATDRD